MKNFVPYRVFQDFESPSSLNLCHCKQLQFPDCGLFNSTVLKDQVKGYLQIWKSLLFAWQSETNGAFKNLKTPVLSVSLFLSVSADVAKKMIS